MKIMFASDIHGDIKCAEAMLDAYKKEGAEKLCLLGDVLYHGPRNDLPADYAPKKVIELLNENREKLICVRGNCDTEVDQMVLNFPILGEYATLFVDGLSMILTHGHNTNAQNATFLRENEILICGHTHILCMEGFGRGNLYLNPGSVSLPKENNPRSYMIYEDRVFKICELETGKTIMEIRI